MSNRSGFLIFLLLLLYLLFLLLYSFFLFRLFAHQKDLYGIIFINTNTPFYIFTVKEGVGADSFVPPISVTLIIPYFLKKSKIFLQDHLLQYICWLILKFFT